MKVFKIVGKNLKLLMRSKTSLLVILFGPLLIMLLVGFAFNNTTASKLNIGYYATDNSNLTVSFIEALKTNPNFELMSFKSEESCTQMIAQAKVHVCIIFPQNLAIENNKTNEIVFYVDQSRQNFIYAVIDTVSSKISFTSTQLSYKMTSDLLNVIDTTKKNNNDQLLKIIKLKATLQEMNTKLDSVKTKLSSLDLSSGNVNVGTTSDGLLTVTTDVSNLRTKGLDVVDSGTSLVTKVYTYVSGNGPAYLNSFNSNLTFLEGNINTAYNTTNTDLYEL